MKYNRQPPPAVMVSCVFVGVLSWGSARCNSYCREVFLLLTEGNWELGGWTGFYLPFGVFKYTESLYGKEFQRGSLFSKRELAWCRRSAHSQTSAVYSPLHTHQFARQFTCAVLILQVNLCVWMAKLNNLLGLNSARNESVTDLFFRTGTSLSRANWCVWMANLSFTSVVELWTSASCPI
jgi:hypothetical protein